MKVLDKIKSMFTGAKPDDDIFDTIRCADDLVVDVFYDHRIMRINGIPFAFDALVAMSRAFADRDNSPVKLPLRQTSVNGLVDVIPNASGDNLGKIMCCNCKRMVDVNGSYTIQGMVMCSRCYAAKMLKNKE